MQFPYCYSESRLKSKMLPLSTSNRSVLFNNKTQDSDNAIKDNKLPIWREEDIGYLHCNRVRTLVKLFHLDLKVIDGTLTLAKREHLQTI